MKDILIVSEDIVGIMELVKKGIRDCTPLTFDYLDHHAIRTSFRYRNLAHRTQNFFLKSFRSRNLKEEHYQVSVEQAIKTLQSSYKKILVIRPDKLTDEHLSLLRGMTDNFIAYYWDSVNYFPRKLQIRHFFDRIL